MTALSETDAFLPSTGEEPIPSTSMPLPSPLLVGATMAVTGAVCRLDEFVSREHPLPHLAQEAVNSGAHPILGFTAIYIGRALGARRLSRLKQAVIYSALTLAADISTEEIQDRVLGSPIHFYEHSRIPENVKDLCFAIGGAGVALGLNKLRNRRSA